MSEEGGVGIYVCGEKGASMCVCVVVGGAGMVVCVEVRVCIYAWM